MPKYRQYLDDTKMSIIDINVLLHQTPGGMLSNLSTQLKEMGNIDKLEEVYKELPRVRKELGQPPLVTPSSQIIGRSDRIWMFLQFQYDWRHLDCLRTSRIPSSP